MTATQRSFEEQEFQELAEVLYLGESVPEHLRSLWEHVGRDAVALARLEDRRMWCAATAEALERTRRATVVLAVSLAAAMQVRVHELVGTMRQRQRLQVTRGGAVRSTSETEATVQLDDADIRVERGPGYLDVTITSEDREIEGVEVESFGDDDQSVARGTTDAGGRVRLPVAEPGEFQVHVSWRAESESGPGRT